jgi:hypothetical protein
MPRQSPIHAALGIPRFKSAGKRFSIDCEFHACSHREHRVRFLNKSLITGAGRTKLTRLKQERARKYPILLNSLFESFINRGRKRTLKGSILPPSAESIVTRGERPRRHRD